MQIMRAVLYLSCCCYLSDHTLDQTRVVVLVSQPAVSDRLQRICPIRNNFTVKERVSVITDFCAGWCHVSTLKAQKQKIGLWDVLKDGGPDELLGHGRNNQIRALGCRERLMHDGQTHASLDCYE